METSKIGPMITPGGGGGNANPQTITTMVQSIGPLPRGVYIVEGDVDMYALQGAKAVIDALELDQAALTALGMRIPSKTTQVLTVGSGGTASDGYVYWVKSGAGSDGAAFRCNSLTRGKVT